MLLRHWLLRFFTLVSCLALSTGLLAQAERLDLVNAFWQATTDSERQAAASALEQAAGDAEALYRWLQMGPEFNADVATGIVERSRTAANGTEFPYVLLVPDSYQASHSYPVEFMLHGGVGRPRPEEGESFWRGGYDSLRQEDRIVVVPLAWNEAIWWQPIQAENISQILRAVRQEYNVDDNRVTLTGVSDGGTGAWFFAFKQPSDWAAFLPYIGHPGVLRNSQSGGGYRLYFENLVSKPFYIVSGENDPLYPAASLASFIEILAQEGVDHTFRVIEGGGHNTRWLPEETPAIEAFKTAHVRDPFPDSIQWVTESSEQFNEYDWIRIDALEEEGRPSLLQVNREDNAFSVTARGVSRFTLRFSPSEVNLADPLLISVNGRVVHTGMVMQSKAAVLEAAANLDRAALYTATLEVEVP